jgi:hypothetical protein
MMILTEERGHVTDHWHTDGNDKWTLIRKVTKLLEHVKAVMSIKTGNVIH